MDNKSNEKLNTCHRDLRTVFGCVSRVMPTKIIEGHRGEKRQNELFNSNPPRTKVKYPDSKHNTNPSNAVDAMPDPIDWGDRERMTLFAGIVLGVANMLAIKIRWGGDWDRDTEVKDNKFDDLVHFELIDPS